MILRAVGFKELWDYRELLYFLTWRDVKVRYEIKISDLVSWVADLTRFESEIRWHTDKPDGQPRRLDVSRAYEKFGFKAHTPFELGLRRTIEWYEEMRGQRTEVRDQRIEVRDEKSEVSTDGTSMEVSTAKL